MNNDYAAYNTPRNVLDDACTVCHIAYDPEDPKGSLNKVINWHVAVALDPLVSGDARDLIARGREEMLRELLSVEMLMLGILMNKELCNNGGQTPR